MKRADLDVEFLNDDDTRGIRLELEYLKAETMLRKHRVRHTVLVFGSTRVKRSSPRYAMARELGRRIAAAGERAKGRGVVMTGGGPGIMEAANRGAHDAGAPSVGLNIDLPHPQKPNPYVTPDLCITFRYFALRKLHFLLRARALVFFPGGYGTFDELFEALTLVQCGKVRPLPIVLVDEAYWRRAVSFDFLLAQGTISPADARIFAYAESARAAWGAITGWYRRAGEPVFP